MEGIISWQDDNTCVMDLQLPERVIAWAIAWVGASLAHGLGGQLRAYLQQTRASTETQASLQERFPGCGGRGGHRDETTHPMKVR